MLNQTLVTKQTGERGRKVTKVRGTVPCAARCTARPVDAVRVCAPTQVFLMERLYMRRELYFSIVLDRMYGGPVVVASTHGGTSIEDVAHRYPDKIIKVGAGVCAAQSVVASRCVRVCARAYVRLAASVCCLTGPCELRSWSDDGAAGQARGRPRLLWLHR
jgi:hypothetical protein